MVIIMLGAPGTGKGTLSTLLSQYYDIPHISTGDILRDAIRRNDKDAELLKEYMESGLLIPDDFMFKIVETRLKLIDCNDGFILDGFPRTKEQADGFYNLLKKIKKNITAVINLETPETEIIERIKNRIVCPKCKSVYNLKTAIPITDGICDKCDTPLIKRKDDTEEKIVERLKEYYSKTFELVDYYKKTGKLFTVNATSSLNKTSKDLLKEIVWYIEGKKND